MFMKNNKWKLTMLITVALLTVFTIGVTVARLMDDTQVLENTFEMGDVNTEIEEDGEGAVKKSRIKNVGSLNCLVRARVTISPSQAADAIELTSKGDGWDWSQWNGGDGYVYYTKVLPAGTDSYTSYLFEGVALKEGTDWKALGIDTFDVTVYEESVQVEVHDGTERITALNEDGAYDAEKAADVWAVYDASANE